MFLDVVVLWLLVNLLFCGCFDLECLVGLLCFGVCV